MAAIKGTIGNNLLQGSAEDDRFTPLRGSDWVFGGAGVDTLVVDYSMLLLGGDSQGSFINSTGSSFSGSIRASDGLNVISFAEIEMITGRLDAGDNRLSINIGSGLSGPAFKIDGGGGNDLLELNVDSYGRGIEFRVGPAGKAQGTIGTFIGFESYAIVLGAGNHIIETGTGNDRIYNFGGNGRINTGSGDDLIVSINSVDVVNGGSGLDTWHGDYERATDALSFTYDGGSGRLSNGTAFASIEKVSLSAGLGDDHFTISAPVSAPAYLRGGEGADSLTADLRSTAGPPEVVIGSYQGQLHGTLGGGAITFQEFERLSHHLGVGDTNVMLYLQGLTAGGELTLDAGGGSDFIYLGWISSEALVLTMDAHGTLTSNVGITLTGFEGFSFQLGGGDDVVFGSAYSDSIHTGDGNDRLEGGAGSDAMKGGAGADTFVFDSLSDLAVQDGIDWVMDFSTTDGDKIDVQGLSDDTFIFLAEGSFSGTGSGPEIRYEADSGWHFVQGDINGDGFADFQFLVTTPVLTATDFHL